ncbi:hypothetical protein AB0F20_29895 [Streptomyces goshikiensis]|uniref:hypothetical protein n=1 Tax=Streptomyces goshikiensis TaxID=1942 RepID=UPI0033F952D9
MTGDLPIEQVSADTVAATTARGEPMLHAFARARGPQNAGDLPDDVYLGPLSSGKAPSDADWIRAQLTAEGASFREGTVMRGARAFTEFHIERAETEE